MDVFGVDVKSGVLDKPVDLTQEDFSIGCAMDDVVQGKAQCDNPATLAVRLHTCKTTVSCQPCWIQLVKFLHDQQRRGPNSMDHRWRCQSCRKVSETFDDLIWIEPL